MNRDTGFFTMQFAGVIAMEKDLQKAKKMCFQKVEEKENARVENIAKANAMIAKATNLRSLVLGVGNFVLAQEGSHNKVIR